MPDADDVGSFTARRFSCGRTKDLLKRDDPSHTSRSACGRHACLFLNALVLVRSTHRRHEISFHQSHRVRQRSKSTAKYSGHVSKAPVVTRSHSGEAI